MSSLNLSFLWILLVCLLASASGQTPQQAEDPHLQHGLELLRQQQFPEALRELEAAHRAHPGAYEIENLLGITATQLGQTQAAEGYYRKAIELNPKAASPHKNLGFNLLNAKAYSDAERELKTALALDPRDPFTRYYLAILYLATSRDAEAVEQFEAARGPLENDPDNAFLMVKACLNTGHNSQALRLTQTMADHSQLTVAQNFELAMLLSNKRMYPEAVLRFQYAVAAQPQSWVAKYNLGIAWLNAAQPQKAILLLEPLAADQPANASILTSLGSAYEATDELPKALNAYQKAVAADPQNPDRYLDYTRLLMDLDRFDEATKIVEDGIQGTRHTEDPYVLDIRLGVLKLKQGSYDEARDVLRQAIVLHPEIVLGYVALAQSFMQQGRDEDALKPLLQARALIPQDATLEYYVGLVSLRVGHLAEAEAALGNSIRLRPEEPEPHYELGKLYFQQNQLDRARSEFERVIALDPSNSNAHYQLGRIFARLGDKEKAAQMASEARRLMQTQRDAALNRDKAHANEFQPPVAN